MYVPEVLLLLKRLLSFLYASAEEAELFDSDDELSEEFFNCELDDELNEPDELDFDRSDLLLIELNGVLLELNKRDRG